MGKSSNIAVAKRSSPKGVSEITGRNNTDKLPAVDDQYVPTRRLGDAIQQADQRLSRVGDRDFRQRVRSVTHHGGSPTLGWHRLQPRQGGEAIQLPVGILQWKGR
jgi:hypothetical protein